MEPIAWILFIVSNSIVIILTAFCFYRVLTIPKEHMHAPLDIDTRDQEDSSENGEEEDIHYPGGL